MTEEMQKTILILILTLITLAIVFAVINNNIRGILS